ncbi:adenosylcobinamide-GDP ribazoletransferase [Clostridium culturomicium]|uniref:adenosylcobinamide-GDP ribazoletransferase n=1 Tax=Clostridium culturomicium TaxID=1499683 RepID=UPI00058C7317|nr:adenosylcobinamide-GDP ribazoletransferase [Clostridium culturomicium]
MKKYFKGFLMAVSMFTIIPLPHNIWDDEGGKHIMKFYPVVGLIVGFIWYGVYKVLQLLGASTMITAAIIMIVPFILTGMLHLDGFMDVCDALLSRRSKEEKLRILKDSHTGAFAVIALAMLFTVNFAAVYTIVDINTNPLGFIFIPIISRSLIGYLLLSKEAMKGSSLGAFFKQGTGVVDRALLMMALIVATFTAIVFINVNAGIMVSVMIVTALLLVDNCCREFDGISGDTAGFGLVMAETVGILILALI